MRAAKASIRPFPHKAKHPPRVLLDRGRLDLYFFGWRAIRCPVLYAGFGDFIQGFQAFLIDLPEVGVVGRQRGVPVVQEELRTIGVFAGVGHGDRPAAVVDGCGLRGAVGRVFVGKLESGPTRSGAARVAALQHVQPGAGQAVACK